MCDLVRFDVVVDDALTAIIKSHFSVRTERALQQSAGEATRQPSEHFQATLKNLKGTLQKKCFNRVSVAVRRLQRWQPSRRGLARFSTV